MVEGVDELLLSQADCFQDCAVQSLLCHSQVLESRACHQDDDIAIGLLKTLGSLVCFDAESSGIASRGEQSGESETELNKGVSRADT